MYSVQQVQWIAHVLQRLAACDEVEAPLAETDLRQAASVDLHSISPFSIAGVIDARFDPFGTKSTALDQRYELAATCSHVEDADAGFQKRRQIHQARFRVAHAPPDLLRCWLDRAL